MAFIIRLVTLVALFQGALCATGPFRRMFPPVKHFQTFENKTGKNFILVILKPVKFVN